MLVKYFGGLKSGVPLYYIKKICGCHLSKVLAHSNYDSFCSLLCHKNVYIYMIMNCLIIVHLNVLDKCVCIYNMLVYNVIKHCLLEKKNEVTASN